MPDADTTTKAAAKVAAANAPTLTAVIVMSFVLRGDIDRVTEQQAEASHRHDQMVTDLRRVEIDCSRLRSRLETAETRDADLAKRIDRECARP